MPEELAELLLTEAAIDKLAARGITTEDAHQLSRNDHELVRNPRSTNPGSRRLLIGRTNGRRTITLVVEQTVDPTTWLIVTGWDSSPIERKLLES